METGIYHIFQRIYVVVAHGLLLCLSVWPICTFDGLVVNYYTVMKGYIKNWQVWHPRSSFWMGRAKISSANHKKVIKVKFLAYFLIFCFRTQFYNYKDNFYKTLRTKYFLFGIRFIGISYFLLNINWKTILNHKTSVNL